LRSYLETKNQIASKERPFGMVNNRIFQKDRRLLIPYLSGHELILHLVEDGVSRRLPAPKFVPGTIFTDDLIADAAGFRGAPIDFERLIFIFTGEDTEPFQIARVRDMAKILQIVNETCNRNEGVYWLRYLVARLCNLSVDEFLRAKNLQQEVYNLVAQLVVFLNGHVGPRHRALARIVVRNFSSLLGKQNLIDRVWNATIDLAEVHIRGSSIVNEIRRSSHHALGKRTLDLANAYLDFLGTGNQEKLRKMGFTAIAEADAKAREASHPREVLDQVVTDLTNLLGRSEIERRIREWQEEYSTSLYQCKFGHSISEELEILVAKGLRPGNRWVYYHHLRILREKAADSASVNGVGSAFLEDCATFSKLQPGGDGFDAESSEASIRQSVAKFLSEIRQHFQEKLFQSINDILDLHEAKAHSQAFVRMHEFRRKLYQRISRKGLNQERYYLFHLDILLEQMGYLELRKIAGDYEENGVRIGECLKIIQMCTANLEYNGLFSRELYDFSVILKDPKKSRAEILNVLQHMARTYHKITQRFTAPFERMQHRFGLDDSELNVALGNMQRYLHDLNSVVHFVEFALQYLRAEDREYSPSDSGPEVCDPVSYHIPHLCHREDVARIVELPGTLNARELYGGKGSGLLYMSYLSIPTRKGFIFPTRYAHEGIYSKDPHRVERELFEHLSVLEHDILQRDGTSKRFGDVKNPMLLSVRGGAVFSMPGILKTAVFVGMSDQIAETIARDNPWCAYDSYRRFLDSFARAVWDLDLEEFDLVEAEKRRHQVRQKKELPWEAMKEVTEASKRIIRERGFGDQLDRILCDPREQVMSAVRAVGRSWDSDVARRYRELKGISNQWNTAVIVQEMTLGNRRSDQVEIGMDETTACLTGVIARTKMADAGVRVFQGDFKFCAAGDDLVSGVATSFRSIEELHTLLPMLEMRLKHIVAKLRRFMGTDQEVEFTVEDGILSILQSRTSETAADSADGGQLVPGEVTTRGVGICGAGFRGLVAFNEADVVELKTQDLGDKDDVDGVLLILENPSPGDIPVILCADGLLSARGGSTAHAALAVNGIEDRSFHAVMGAARFHVDTKEHEATMVDPSGKQHRIRKGDIVSIHGSTGEVYVGSRPIIRDTSLQMAEKVT
jgi:hypothetical protein